MRRLWGGGAAVALLAALVWADGALAAPWCSTGLVVLLGVLLAAEVGELAGRGIACAGLAAVLAALALSARLGGLWGGAGEGLAARGLLLAFAALVVHEVLRSAPARGGPRIAAVSTSLLFVFAFGYLLDLLWRGGVGVAAWVVLAAKASDMGGYLVGRLVGGPRLIPRVSPNKTWSGALGGLGLTAGVVALGAGPLGIVLAPLSGALLAGGLFLAALAGDLGASLLKRWAGVKDSGRLVPTFGGVLDLVDSLVLAAPVGYSFLVWQGVLPVS